MARLFYRLVLVVVAALSAGDLAHSDVIRPNLPPGSKYQLILITGGGIAATSSDVSVYNTFAAAQITNPALTVLGATWKAVVSTPTVRAIDNSPTSSLPIYNTAGQLVKLHGSDLWNDSISNFILDQFGQSDPELAWTGTDSSKGGPYFSGWSLGGGGSYAGAVQAVVGGGAGGGGLNRAGSYLNRNWCSEGLQPWTDRHPVFALSSPIVVSAAKPGRATEKTRANMPAR